MLFSGKIPSYVAARLTARYWVPYLLRFAAICHYLPLFGTVRDCSPLFALFVLFAIRCSLFAVRYSRLFAIRHSGFPDTQFELRKHVGAKPPPKCFVSCWVFHIISHYLKKHWLFLHQTWQMSRRPIANYIYVRNVSKCQSCDVTVMTSCFSPLLTHIFTMCS